MGSKMYTRRGDGGQTSLLDGSRTDKDAPRVRAYGSVDEACSWVGAALGFVDPGPLAVSLTYFQHRLYNCSSCLAAPPGTACRVEPPSGADVTFLEEAINDFEEQTGPIKVFVLPGGCRAAGLLHVARTVCRRAEREMVALARTEEVAPELLTFVNRGSDFLFAAARLANHLEGVDDVAWDGERPPPTL